MEVPRLGAKPSRERRVPLRIRTGKHPLDNTAVHRSATRWWRRCPGCGSLPGGAGGIRRRLSGGGRWRAYRSDDVGLPHPGRHPGTSSAAPAGSPETYDRGLPGRRREMKDLQRDGREGVVTNVVAFAPSWTSASISGLGEHSQLPDRFWIGPRRVVEVEAAGPVEGGQRGSAAGADCA